jgi:uncharacterized membrane protein YfcA
LATTFVVEQRLRAVVQRRLLKSKSSVEVTRKHFRLWRFRGFAGAGAGLGGGATGIGAGGAAGFGTRSGRTPRSPSPGVQ